MGICKLGFTIAAVAALALASACAASPPPQVASYGYSPAYERGIDQDISAGHDGGSATLDNVGPGSRSVRLMDR